VTNFEELAQIVKGAFQLLNILALCAPKPAMVVLPPSVVPATLKLCAGQYGCGQMKPRFTDFAVRRLKCKASKLPGHLANCSACEALLTNPNNRQPRCKTCDVKRKRQKPPVVVVVTPITASDPTPIGATPIKIPTTAKKRQRISQARSEPAIKRISRHRFSGPPSQGPQLLMRPATHGKPPTSIPAQPTEIMRMISALFNREDRIKRSEELVGVVQDQIKMVESRPNQATRDQEAVTVLRSDLVYAQGHLVTAKAWRDFTSKKIHLLLDHAISTMPYRSHICKACRKGLNKNTADPQCKECQGTGAIKVKKTNHYSIAIADKLRHLKKVMPVTELCAKIKAKTSEANAAYQRLLESNMGLIRKFRSENQTSMEQDDAEQGAMVGILDAAMRFNPVKPESYICTKCENMAAIPECKTCEGKGEINEKDCRDCGSWGIRPTKTDRACEKCRNPRMMVKTSSADFKTYAYNWARRNSRARKDTDKRAGAATLGGRAVRSLDAIVDEAEEGQAVNVVGSDAHPALGVMGGQQTNLGGSSPLSMDLRRGVAALADPQQRAVINYTLAGLSLGEIAQALGVTKASVSKLRDAAYAVLRGRMTGYMETESDD
jgi:DNA-directed RNA polymerase specialized sigma24 family protein